VPEKEVFRRALEGVEAIKMEVAALGVAAVQEQLDYVLYQPASAQACGCTVLCNTSTQ
jgi:hypothetical protein